jgi:triacylglycerol esterase/lipase EstA (alpha/beta hydrolase family)
MAVSAAFGLSALTMAVPAASSAAASTTYPVNTDVVSAFATGLLNPTSPPPGADHTCAPTTAHPDPVVLVNGTFENENDNWQALAPMLANAGYCVYTFNYGGTWYSGPIYSIGPIAASAAQLSTFVNHVLSVTHASKVDLVGHSQGGMMPRYYLKFLGGAAKVSQLIGLAPSTNGTTLDGLATLADWIPGASALLGVGCPSCSEQFAGSTFLQTLNAGGDTVPGVQYTVIETTHDEVVTPYQSAFLTGSGVTNITWQTICPDDPVGHIGMAYDTGVLTEVLNTLDPGAAQPITCVSGFSL